MNTINELKKVLKPLGFTITVKSFSYGKHATYKHIESKELLNFNVFTPDRMEKWKPLLDFRKDNQEKLKQIRIETNILGLI